MAAAEVQKIWDEYPQDRRRYEASCLNRIEVAIREVGAADLGAAVRAYAKETAGYTSSKVGFSDNWLRAQKWRGYVAAVREKRQRRLTAISTGSRNG